MMTSTPLTLPTPSQERRSSAVSLAFSGVHAGSIVGLLASPVIIEALGWRALFFSFGALGFVWFLAFEALVKGIQKDDPEMMDKLTARVGGAAAAAPGAAAAAPSIPYRAFLRDSSLQASMPCGVHSLARQRCIVTPKQTNRTH